MINAVFLAVRGDTKLEVRLDPFGASADFAAALTSACFLNPAKSRPPVAMAPRSKRSSSPLPLTRMRQSHAARLSEACWLRMLVVQLVVTALYQRGFSCSWLSAVT